MAPSLEYFDTLLGLLELERQAEHARLQELRDTLSLSELEQKGLVALDLESVDETLGLGGRFLVSLERPNKQFFKQLFSQGDVVEVRPRKAEIPQPARAIVSRATRRRLELAFDRPPPAFISEGRLRIDLVANDITFDRARNAVLRTQAQETGRARDKREILLGRMAPRFDVPKPLKPTRPLNPEQQDAVARALSATDFFLVHGPPGTGKSTVLAEVAVQAVQQGKKLLCTAASNAAVDHLLELCLQQGLRAVRLGHPARVLPHLQSHTLDLLVEEHPDRKISKELFDDAFDLMGYARKQRTQGRSRERFSHARESTAEAKKLLNDARALERKAVASILDSAEVICVTCSSLESPHLAGLSFDLALLDEATQVIEPLALGVFLEAPTVILAGDHRQLPPTVLSEKAAAQGLARSLFERLLETHGDNVKRMLREQYRMNENIMRFSSQEMYQNELRAHESVASHTLQERLPACTLDVPPVIFLDTAGKGFQEEALEGTSSLRNPQEGALVIAHARALLAAGLAPSELGIIAPYRGQAEWLTEELGVPEVEVDTVDAFQGREKEAILVSLTRSNSEGAIGFLSDLRRMNVALTRARRHLFVVGDGATLCADSFYTRFLEYSQVIGGYRSAWEWPGVE